jgi:transposase, IS6 family
MCCKAGWSGLIGLGAVRTRRPAMFKRRHFAAEMIVVCVRWYLRYALSYRDLEDSWQNGISAWIVSRSGAGPALCRNWPSGVVENFDARMHPGGWMRRICRWPVSGPIYNRAVDSEGSTIDFFLSPNRDAVAAKQFFREALRDPGHARPRVINVDGNPSCPKVIAERNVRSAQASVPVW